MHHILEVERSFGITGHETEAIVRDGDIGILEHVVHELAHAVLLDIVLDCETRNLSDGISHEIAERERLQQNPCVSASYEIDAMATELLVVEQLGLPIHPTELCDALQVQVAHTIDDYVERLKWSRDTGHVIDAAKKVCSIVAPMGREPGRDSAEFSRQDREGFEIVVYRMIAGNARLCISEPNSDVYLNAWCYQSDGRGSGLRKAIAGAAEWDGTGDDPPGGWYRNPQSGRRRPGGDPEQEFVHW